MKTPPSSERRQIAFLLAAPPEHAAFAKAIAAIDYAAEQGNSVFIYAIDEGVRAVANPALQERRRHGLPLWACAYGAEKRGLPIDDSAEFAGLSVVADFIGRVDKFVCVSRVGSPMGSQPGHRHSPPRTLVLIDADPEAEARAAESVRIAAGIGAWDITEVTLCVRGPGLALLTGSNPDTWIDGRDAASHLQTIASRQTPIHAVEFPEVEAELLASITLDSNIVIIPPEDCTDFFGGFDAVIAI